MTLVYTVLLRSLGKATDTLSLSNTNGKVMAEVAAEGAAQVQNSIRELVQDLPQKIIMAKQIRDNTKDGESAIQEANSTGIVHNLGHISTALYSRLLKCSLNVLQKS